MLNVWEALDRAEADEQLKLLQRRYITGEMDLASLEAAIELRLSRILFEPEWEALERATRDLRVVDIYERAEALGFRFNTAIGCEAMRRDANLTGRGDRGDSWLYEAVKRESERLDMGRDRTSVPS
jgi:hypothetical protein